MSYQAPDLASVLKTLASLTPKQPQSVPQPLPAAFGAPEAALPLQTKECELEDGEYEPPDSVSEIRASQGPTTTSTPERSTLAREPPSWGPKLHSVGTSVSTRPVEAAAPIDATTITDWPAGLRYVMKAAAQSDAIMIKIKEVRCSCMLYGGSR